MPLDLEAFAAFERVSRGQLFQREGALIDLRRLAEREPVDYDVVHAYAMGLLELGRHREAVDVLRTIIEAEPDSWNSRLSLGASYVNVGEYALARAQLREVAAHADLEAESQKAQELLGVVDTREAEAELRRLQTDALRERVTSRRAGEQDLVRLAAHLISEATRSDDAALLCKATDLLEQAQAEHGDSVEILEALAFCYRRHDPHSRLDATLRALEGIAPESAVLELFGDPEAFELDRRGAPLTDEAFLEGYALERAGDDEGAVAAYQRAIDSRDPEHAPRAAVNLGNLLARKDDGERARIAYRVAIDSAHTDASPKAAQALGSMLATHGRVDEAAAAYREAAASGHPDQAPKAMHSLAQLLEESGDLTAARATYERVIESRHLLESPMAAVNLANMLAHQRDIDGARAAYAHAIDTGTPLVAATAAMNLAQVLAREGNRDDVLAALRHAMHAGDPDLSPKAAVELGQMLADEGDVDGLLAALRYAAQSGHAEAAPVAALNLGVVHARRGEVAMGRAAFEQAIASGPPTEAAQAALRLGMLLEDDDDLEGAVAAYRQAAGFDESEIQEEAIRSLAIVEPLARARRRLDSC
jgi:Flp pilus assembly protein TadD